MHKFTTSILLSLTLAGCGLDDTIAAIDALAPTSSSGADDVTTSGDGATTVDDPGIMTVTSATASASDSNDADTNTGTDSGDTTGEPVEPPTLPPKILNLELDPTTVWTNRGIHVSVLAENTEQVLLQSHLGDVPLVAEGDGVFVGEIPITSGLFNGQHEARVVPFASEVEGDAATKTYEVSLPDPGSAYFWEVDYARNGVAVAAAALPDQSVIEFRTENTPDGPRCTMLRRGEFGTHGPGDLVEIAPGNWCEATDIKVASDGAIYLLSKRKAGAFTPWHLLRMLAWGEPLVHFGLGSEGETAVALAAHPYENAVAVCGTAATGKADMVDVMAWTFGKDLLPNTWTKDYAPEGKQNKFAEHVNDCVFTEHNLEIVGEMWGPHGLEDKPRNRLFFARIDIDEGSVNWLVAPPDGQQNSGAHAVATDPSGNLYVGGYACGHPCDEPEGELRIYAADYFLVRKESLGYFPASDETVFDVAWSPADYPLVTTLGVAGAFTVRAFQRFGPPLWTFNRNDLGAVHRAKAMALGKYGQLYITGIGHTDHPAFAILAP